MESSWGPSAYQPNTLLLGQAGSYPARSPARTFFTGFPVSGQPETQFAVAGEGADVVVADMLTTGHALLTLVDVCNTETWAVAASMSWSLSQSIFYFMSIHSKVIFDPHRQNFFLFLLIYYFIAKCQYSCIRNVSWCQVHSSHIQANHKTSLDCNKSKQPGKKSFINKYLRNWTDIKLCISHKKCLFTGSPSLKLLS